MAKVVAAATGGASSLRTALAGMKHRFAFRDSSAWRLRPVAVMGILIASSCRQTESSQHPNPSIRCERPITFGLREGAYEKIHKRHPAIPLSFISGFPGMLLRRATVGLDCAPSLVQVRQRRTFLRMMASQVSDGPSNAAEGSPASADGVGEAWVQRKVSIKLALDSSGQPGQGIADMIQTSVKEIEQYRMGIAHLQLQAVGLGLSVGARPTGHERTAMLSSTASVPITQGKLCAGADGSSVFLHVAQSVDEDEDGSPSRSRHAPPVDNGTLAFELLVTLQRRRPPDDALGDRGLASALPATHVVGLPREGDEESPLRAAALDAALEEVGGSPADILSEEFQGSAARRAYLSFVNPRPNRVSNKKETLEEAAKRTAVQVSFLEREHRAMLAEFLRNADAARSRMDDLGMEPHRLVLVLDNVRSVYNVGSIFRTAETARVQEIITCGITPHPPHEKLRKTALSAVECVKSRHFDNILDAIATLRDEGVRVMGMETTSRSKSYTQISYPEPSALVLGNELTGISTQAMDACDDLIEIPTFGLKNSLNVASACPVVVFEVLRQWRKL